MTSIHRLIAPLLISLAASACMPTSGPRGEDVVNGPTETSAVQYCLIKLTPEVATVAAKYSPRFAGAFNDDRPPTTVRVGIGDVISVTIYESAAGGLFFPAEGALRQGNFLTLPNQIVDSHGNLTVPYAGQIRAVGRTAPEIQRSIVDALKNRALEPQVVVTIVEQRSSLLTVLGEVNTPLRVALSHSGERVLDAITRAGGIKAPGQESWVLLDRGGQKAIAPFGALLYEPHNNIYVRARDTIYVYRQPQTFTAFGAAGKQGQFPFEAWKITLAEALAKAGGLIDIQAEPSWVFLYRFEPRKVVEELGVKCECGDDRYVPVIYQLDLRDPSGFFLATRFLMKDHDVIYASNARSVETSKFLNYVRLINGTIKDPIDTAVSAYTLKNLIHNSASTAIIVSSP